MEGETSLGSSADSDDETTTAGTPEVAAASAAPVQAGLQVTSSHGGNRLQFAVPHIAHVKLELFDVKGRRVRTLVDQDAAAGTFSSAWDGHDDSGAVVSDGVYFAHFALDGQTVQSRKVMVLR